MFRPHDSLDRVFEIGIIAKGSLFIGYQLYRIALHRSAGLIALTIFDAFVLVLTALEYRRQRQHREEYSGAQVD
jgi:uncharacterized membrane protein